MMTDDIDTFIRNQKDKLRLERQAMAPQIPAESLALRSQKAAGPTAGGPRQRAPAARPGPVVPPLDDLSDSIVAPLPRSQPPKQPLTVDKLDDAPRLPPRPEEDPERPLVSKMGQYDERRRKFNAERQDDYLRLKADEDQAASRRRRGGDLGPESRPPFLPGAKSDSAKVRAKVEERNKEYQEFKALEEQKFQRRFEHKKPTTSHGKWAEPTPRPRAKTPPPARRQTPPERPYDDGGPVFGELEKWEELLQGRSRLPTNLERHNSETRLDELERAVRELRGLTHGRQSEQPLERQAAERHRQRRWSQTQLEAPPEPPPPPQLPEASEGGFLALPERRSGLRRREEERNREYNEFLRQVAAKEDAKRASRFRDDSPRRDDTLTEQRYLTAMMDNRGEAPSRRQQQPMPRAPAPAAKGGGPLRFQDNLLKLDSLDSLYDNTRAKLVSRRDAPKSDSEWLSPRTIKDLDKLPPKGPGRRQPGGGGGGGGRRADDEETGLAVGRNASESAQKRKKDRYRQELEEQMEEARQRARREKEEERNELPDAPLTRSRSHSELIRGGGGASLTPARSTGGLDTLFGPASDAAGLSSYGAQADDPYHFYGQKNPFDSNGYGDDVLMGEQFGSRPAGGGGGKNVHFESPRAGATPGLLAGPDKTGERKAQQQKEYANELQRQMEEKKKQKVRAKADQEAYDRKFEAEQPFFSAFGRGGGGAPVKDAEGNVRADLRSYLADGGPAANRQNAAAGPPQTSRRSAFETSPYEESALRLNLTGTRGGVGGGVGGGGGGGGDGGGLNRSSRNERAGGSGPTPRSAHPQTNAFGEVTHARGGHGILGQPLTDEQKESRNKLRSYLDMQIEEKRQMREREREEQRLAEEREMRKIQEERRKMQLEEEEDRRRRAEKEEEAKRRNEEAMRRQEEEKRQRQIERSPRAARQPSPEPLASSYQPEPRYERSSSPPVPAVLNALKKEGKPTPRSPRTPRGSGRDPPPQASPRPAPEAAQPTPRAVRAAPQDDLGSSFALRDLRRIKQQLHSERERVERALMQQHYSVDVSDPRLSARAVQTAPRPVAVVQRPPIDPFESAYEKQRPVPVRRQPPPRTDTANDRELGEFNALKGSTVDYPSTPLTASELEMQQERYLREQELRLRRLQVNQRSGSSFAADMPGMAPQDLGLVPRGASPDDMTQLQAETAFIGINGAPFESAENPFSLPPTERPLLSDSAMLQPSARSNQVDPDFLARKNAERFRRLQAMEQENNLASNVDDHEEVLARFLEKQGRRSRAEPSPSRPRNGSRPPRAPSSGRALPFDLSRPPAHGLDAVTEHESALDSPLEPEPVTRPSDRAAERDLDAPSGLYVPSPPDRESIASR